MTPPMTAGHYLHEGFLQLSLGNLLVIGVMILVFVLALVLPFPGAGSRGHAPVRRSRTGR